MKKKFLCLCWSGINRSGSLVYSLREQHKQDAIAYSIGYNSKATCKMLADWADYILVPRDPRLCPDTVCPPGERVVEPENTHKIRFIDEIGSDVWGSPTHPDLLKLAQAATARLMKEIK